MFGKPQVAKVKTRKRIQKHHGGAWRAFVKLMCVRQRGRPDLLALAQQFHAAKECNSPIIQEAFELGETMSKVAKMCLSSSARHKMFCKSSKQFDAMRLRSVSEAFLEKHEGKDDIALSLAVCASAEPNASITQQQKMAKSLASMLSAKKREADAELVRVLDEFQSTLGNSCIEELQRSLPELSQQLWQVVPDPTLSLLLAKDDKIKDLGTRLASWASGNPTTNLGPVADKYWEQYHQTKHAPEGLVDSEDAAEKLNMSPCQEVGFCICSGHGLQLDKCRGLLHKHMKAAHKVKQEKDALGSGKVVLHLFHPVSEGEDFNPDECTSFAEEKFLHVCHIVWSPYRPVFHSVKHTDCNDIDLLGCIFVEASCNFHVDWYAIKGIDLSLSWYLDWYDIVDAAVPTLSAVPNTVALMKRRTSVVKLWPLQRQVSGPRTGQGARHVQPLTEWSMVAAGAKPKPQPQPLDVTGDDDGMESCPLVPSAEDDADYDEESDYELMHRVQEEILVEDHLLQVEEPICSAGTEPALVPLLPEPGLGGATASSSHGVAHAEDGPTDALPRTGYSGPRFPADAMIQLDNNLGKIAYHRSKDAYEAHCPCHARCVLTRTCKGKKKVRGTASAQGRPLGMLVAWLQMGEGATSREAHWDKAKWIDGLSLDKRRAGRQLLKDMRESHVLFPFERPLLPGEEDEPVDASGLF
eukprot:6491798-Amphidinium_carterae.2